MDTPVADTTEFSPTHERRSSQIAEAAIARLASAHVEDDEALRFTKERDLRQHFRRLIDPGIVRPNKEPAVIECINVSWCLKANLNLIIDFRPERF